MSVPVDHSNREFSGTESRRRAQGVRRAAWIFGGFAAVVAVGEVVLLTIDLGNPELDGVAWVVWLVVMGLASLMVLLVAWEQRVSARAWTAALSDLTAVRPDHGSGPADAVVELAWNERRDVAHVWWDGIEVGRWAPSADGDGIDGRGWHLIGADVAHLPPGHLARDHSFEPSLRRLARLRLDHRRYLLTEDTDLLVDGDGREWALGTLLDRRARHTSGRLPQALGPDGAVFVLRARFQLATLRARRRSSST